MRLLTTLFAAALLITIFSSSALASPQWSNISTDFGLSSPHLKSSYQINVSWNSSDANTSVVLIEHNFTGTLTNYTVTAKANSTYYYNYGSLSPGTYRWREFANDTSGAWNVTDDGNYRAFDVYLATLSPGEGMIDLSIASNTAGVIKSISHKSYIYVNETLFVGVEFMNTGSTTYDEYVDINVKSSNLTTIYQFRSPVTYNLAPGMVTINNITVLPPDAGYFYIQVRASYGTQFTELWSIFLSVYPDVCGNYLCESGANEDYKNCPTDCKTPICGNGYCETDESYENCANDCYPPVCGNGYCEVNENYVNCFQDCPWYVLPPVTQQPSTPYVPPAPPALPETGKADMSLDYTSIMEAYVGDVSSTYIIVNNTGNLSLGNVRLQITSENFASFEVSPKVVPSLPRNRSTIFLVSLTVLNDTQPGTRSFYFTVSSNQTNRDGKIFVEVNSVAVDESESLEQKITNYKFLILKVGRDLDTSERDGLNVTDARQELDRAKAHLNLATSYINKKDFASAKDDINMALDSINNAIYKASTASITIVAPAYSNIWILLAAIVLGLVPIALVYLLRVRKKKRPAMLERMEKGEND